MMACWVFQVVRGEQSGEAAVSTPELDSDDSKAELAPMTAEAQGVLDRDAPTASDDPRSSPVSQEV